MLNLPWCRTLASAHWPRSAGDLLLGGNNLRRRNRSSSSAASGTSPRRFSSRTRAYRITVEMLPVKAFDPATNKRLNLSKAQDVCCPSPGETPERRQVSGSSSAGLKSGKAAPAANSSAWSPTYRETASPVAAAQTASAKEDADGPAVSRPPAAASASGSTSFECRPMPPRPISLIGRRTTLTPSPSSGRHCPTKETRWKGQPLSPDDFYDAVGSLEERSECGFPVACHADRRRQTALSDGAGRTASRAENGARRMSWSR